MGRPSSPAQARTRVDTASNVGLDDGWGLENARKDHEGLEHRRTYVRPLIELLKVTWSGAPPDRLR